MNTIETERTPEIKTQVTKRVPFKKGSILKKLDQESAKLFMQIKDQINKKPYGRKVRDWEIMSVALKQINQEHIKELQTQTYSEKDRLMLAHEDYQKANGKISLDQFIGKLIRKEI